jgi:hypothetical protein
MEPENKISTEVSQKDVDPVLFFDKNSDFVLAYKKTEKLASAVYMVTGLMSDSEPIKWTLRKKVGELLSFILTYKDTPQGSLVDFIYSAKTKTTELVSLLEVSLRGGLVSLMNFSILKQEFLNLISILNNSSAVSGNESVSKTFFDLPHSYSTRIPEQAGAISRVSLSNVKDRGLNVDKDNLKKSNRQTIILDLLKKRKELTIKDIAQVIKDCSEKTIQRELNTFISNGVLKRAGVRRWSRYSLA